MRNSGYVLIALVFVFSGRDGLRATDFIRGDVNGDGRIDISDPLNIVAVFTRGISLPCADAADFDDDGRGTTWMYDVDSMYSYLFKGSHPPPPPFPSPGPDETEDRFGCDQYPVIPPPPQGSFALDFEFDGLVSGSAGAVVTFDVFATLTTTGNLIGPRGAQGWSLSIGADGLKVLSVTIEGTDAAVALDGGLEKSEVVDPGVDPGTGPQGQGAVSAVFLTKVSEFPPVDRMLPPEGTARIARITLEAVVPTSSQILGRLFFIDGKQGTGQPVPNVVTMENASHIPALGSIEIYGAPVLPQFRRGDANADERIDVSDAVSPLQATSFGPELPCNDAGDWDDDGEIYAGPYDLGFAWNYLFKGGPRPPAPGFVPGVDPTTNNKPPYMGCDHYPVPPAPPGASFILGVEGCPTVLSGASGEVKSFEVLATLTTTDNLTDKGAKGWSMSIGAEGLKIVSITTQGTEVLSDGMILSEVVDPAVDNGSGAQGQGAVSAVILPNIRNPDPPAEDRRLPPEGTARIARITLEATIPQEPTQARLFYVDGKKGQGQPVPNVVTMTTIVGRMLETTSCFPTLGSCAIDLRPVAPGGLQRPGDGNQDGGLDLSDAVWLLGHLFLGTAGTEVLPCEGGTAGSPGAGDLALVDSNGDGKIDLSDPLSVLSWLFLGSGRPHPLGTECVRIAGCPERCGR